MDNPINSETNNLTPTPESPKQSWYLKYRFALYGVVVLLVIAASGLVLWMNRSTNVVDEPTNVESPADNPQTANWNTYSNEQYGFSFKYPGEWTEPEYIYSELGGVMSINLGCPEVKNGDVSACPLSVHVALPGDRTNFLNKSYFFTKDNNITKGDITTVTINGSDAALFTSNSAGAPVYYNSVIYGANYFYLIRDNGLAYQSDDVFKSILSSFKLSNPIAFATNSVSGTIKKIGDLGLFKPVSMGGGEPTVPSTVYYEAGVIQTGKYKNYKRIIAVTEPEGPSGPIISTYATADNKTYVLDIQNTYLRDTYYQKNSDYISLDYKKIIAADLIPTNHPYALTGYNNSYSIVKSQRFIGVDYYNITDIPAGAVSLPSKDANLKLFAVPVKFTPWDNANEQEKQYIDQKNAYLETADPILVQDNTGLVYNYDVYNKTALDRGLGDFYTASIIKADFETSQEMYDEYQYLLPDGCGVAPHYTLKNVSSNDLVFLAKHKSGDEYYRFKDANHPLYQAQYFNKVSAYTAEEFKLFNGDDAVMPTYEQYVKNNPIIITKDPWGRYTAVGEDKYFIPGGCGKPVIYLYPPQNTEVSVKFMDPVVLTKDIPVYNNGWKVLAHPDGALTDLQPRYTDCSALKTGEFGSEYAQQACVENSYPYLYWAGFTLNKYPSQTTGWVVAKSDLERFINDKLTLIGLNAKESQDMLEYWVPKMLAKDAPYYRVSFLQTAELNRLFPMSVNPQPDSVIRVFLDWEDLSAKPTQSLPPQKLTPIKRSGFTYVEWGGLNR